MKLNMTPVFARSAKRILFISPHLDDAILSCASLISYLGPRIEVGIVTVFSEGSSGQLTQFAQSFVASCGYSNSQALFRQRRKEEKAVCDEVGARSFLGGFIDASMRIKTANPVWKKVLSIIYPEMIHVYPFEASVFSGRVDLQDSKTMISVTNYLRKVYRSFKPDVVFCPLAIGGHVDHRVVRDICVAEFKNIVYWSDFPYLIRAQIPRGFISKRNLRFLEWTEGNSVRPTLIRHYESQLSGLFPDGRIPDVSERYYFSD